MAAWVMALGRNQDKLQGAIVFIMVTATFSGSSSGSATSVAPCRCQEVQPATFRLPLLVLTIAGCAGTAPPNQLQTEFILRWKPWKSELEGK
jgi:hypothetical protein